MVQTSHETKLHGSVYIVLDLFQPIRPASGCLSDLIPLQIFLSGNHWGRVNRDADVYSTLQKVGAVVSGFSPLWRKNHGALEEREIHQEGRDKG